MSGEVNRWLILLIVITLATGGVYYEYQITRPCAEPVEYTIGAIDPGFDVSTSTVLAGAEAAASIWNTAAGRTLLEYSPTGPTKINLVYDSRQSIAQLGAQITQEVADENTDRASIEAERSTVTPATEATFNAQVDAYNAGVDALNTKIAEFNQEAGGTFEEGEYIRDASGSRIEIYEFIGDTQLERVLAHEMGHAIGLGHNSNPASIMYAENESGNLTPSPDDIAALNSLCHLK